MKNTYGWITGYCSLQYQEAGWNQFPIMEEADLACVGTEKADKTNKAQRDKARGYGRRRVERNG